MQKRRKQCDHRDTDWRDVTPNHEMLTTAIGKQRQGIDSPLETLEPIPLFWRKDTGFGFWFQNCQRVNNECISF